MLQLAKCNRNLQEVLEVGQTSQGSGGSSLKCLLSRRNQKFKAAVSQVVPKTSTELFFLNCVSQAGDSTAECTSSKPGVC